MTFPWRTLVAFVCLLAIGADKQKSTTDPATLVGAWLQTNLKWEAAPSTINPQLRTSQAAILYFGEDHAFALMYCVVNQVPAEYIVISHGDGLGLYRGQWTTDRKGIVVWYQFVPIRPRQWPEGPETGLPIQHATVSRSHHQLSFADMKFEREQKLDDDAHEAMLTSSNVIESAPVR